MAQRPRRGTKLVTARPTWAAVTAAFWTGVVLTATLFSAAIILYQGMGK
jgi:hypothetical protein